MAPRKPWSRTIEAHGIKIRLFERNGTIYRDLALGRTVSSSGKARTVHDIKSMRHGDRRRAENDARELARAIAEQRLTGTAPDTLTVGQLYATYTREAGPLLTPRRRMEVARAFRLLRKHVGSDFRVADFGPHRVSTYIASRRAGTLTTRQEPKSAGFASIAKELNTIVTVCRWASRFRHNGRPLLTRNPLDGVAIPNESTPARPVASVERYRRLVDVASRVEASGTFPVLLHVAWATGRRIGSIVALTAGDVLLTPAAVETALARSGVPDPGGWDAAIRWSREADKQKVEWIVPIPEALRAALAEYIRARGLVGRALLFPGRHDRTRPLPVATASYWLRRAEQLAGLPHQRRGGWHAFRRAWATQRKAFPLVDVMRAGGWTDDRALKRAYQQPDADTVRRVMDIDG